MHYSEFSTEGLSGYTGTAAVMYWSQAICMSQNKILYPDSEISKARKHQNPKLSVPI